MLDQVWIGPAWLTLVHTRGDFDKLQVEDVREYEAVGEQKLQHVWAAVKEDLGDVR